jgi:quercetin dioxygenase-like cupin family protein
MIGIATLALMAGLATWSWHLSADEGVAPRALVLRRASVMARKPDIESPSVRVWTLRREGHARTNLVEMRGPIANHVHPDADHTLMVLEGQVDAWAGREVQHLGPGDYISIPKGMPHRYEVRSGTALLVSFDAPAYDPALTRRVAD